MSDFHEYSQERPPETDREDHKKGRGCGLMALALCFSLLGGAIGAGAGFFGLRLWNRLAPGVAMSEGTASLLQGLREQTILETVPVDTGKLMTAAQVYSANVNSTVGITTAVTTNFWGYQSTSAASGSGFVLTRDGYVLTNHHVIEASDRITVTLYNEDTYEATVVGYDESNDIAVLKIDAENLSPVILGSSEQMNIGDEVIAIGNPLGELTFSLTAGRISAKDREVTFSNGVMMNLLQTDCAINSGNSGGALFNLYGEVIGVTNAKYSGSSQGSASIDNIGFAIPMDSVRGIIESIIEKGYVSKPHIGVSVTDTPQEYQLYGLPQGATVRNVEPDSPAATAGLQPGDIITKANDRDITGSKELVRFLRECTPGQQLSLTLYRKGETLTLSVTVGEQKLKPASGER